MKTRLTSKQYWYLSVIAYLDIPDKRKNEFVSGKTTLRQMTRIWIDDIMRNWVFSNVTQTYHPPYFNPASLDPSAITREEWVLILLDIYDDPFSKDVVFYNFVYQDGIGQNGLCFYDFLYPYSSRIIAFRGSKFNSGDPLKEKDWQDNFYMALFESNQYNDIADYLKSIKYNCTIHATGHSKGGNNALYCRSIDERVTGCVFDAPGFGITLSGTQYNYLKNSDVINYVCCDDWVGAILCHPERRVFCKNKVETDGLFDLMTAHIPQQFIFDEHDNIVEQERTERSITFEKVIQNTMDAILGECDLDEILNQNSDLIWPLVEKHISKNGTKLEGIKAIGPAMVKRITIQSIKRIVRGIMRHKKEDNVYDLICGLIKEWGERARSFDEADSANVPTKPIANFLMRERWTVAPEDDTKKHYKFKIYY